MSETPPQKSRKLLGCVLLLFGFPLFLCGGLATWWFGREAIDRAELDRRLAALVDRGMPVGNESLARFRAQHTEPENAQRWMVLLEKLESKEYLESTTGVPIVGDVPEEELLAPKPLQPWKHEAEAREFLDAWSQLSTELHLLAEGSGPVRTHIEFESFSTLLPYVQACRQAARLLALEHQLAVSEGDGKQCYHSLMAIFGTARTIEGDPLLVSQLVRYAVASIGIDSLRQSLAADLLSEQQLREIDQQLAAFDGYSQSFEIGIAGERAMALAVFDDPSSLHEPVPPFHRSADALAALDLFAKAEAIAAQNLEPTEFLKALETYEAEVQQEFQDAGPLRKFDTMMTSLMFPAVGPYGKAALRTAMNVRLARLAIGVRLYQKKFDRWPPSLGDLKDVGISESQFRPSGGKPFGYRVIDNQALLWGFVPNSSSDQTPADPIDLESVEENQREELESWLWKLERSSDQPPE